MKLKQLIFSLFCLLPIIGFAQTSHEQHVEKAKDTWMKIIPNIGTLQYAGDIGYASVGIGWDYGKRDRWETHIQVGFLPKSYAYNFTPTFTLRESLIPWSLGMGKRSWADAESDKQWNRRSFCSFEPAVFSLFMNTIFGDEFWVHEPEKYNGGNYYRFSSKVRTHIGFGSRLSFNIPRAKQRHFERVSLYYELSSYDLAIISAIPNKSITLDDILCLGFGMQYKFF